MGSKREPEAEGGLLPLAAPGNFPDGAVRRAQKRGSVASCALFPNGLNLRSLSSAQATVRSYGTVSVSPMLSFAEPRLKDRQELLATTSLWRYCEDEHLLLAYCVHKSSHASSQAALQALSLASAQASSGTAVRIRSRRRPLREALWGGGRK